MKFDVKKLVCRDLHGYHNSNREGPFWIGTLELNFESCQYDQSILTKITDSGIALARKVNHGAANNSNTRRAAQRIKANAIAGVLAEYAWKAFLNTVSLELQVKETLYVDSTNQIDLETINSGKTIEVRSSFPRNGISFAVCSDEFDIIGPYSNDYKPSEIQKNYYLRTLFHVQSPVDFLKSYIKNGFVVYLTGGATWEMMVNDDISINKNFIPEDTLDLDLKKTNYRVVPFSRALDTSEICKIIRDCNTL